MESKIKFFCINLPSRKDRWKNCCQQFRQQWMDVERWNATPLPENRRFGAWLSHREIIEEAQRNKWNYVWVFEDDIEFVVDNFIEQCISAIAELKNTDWYILYFGWLIDKGGKLRKHADLKQVFQVEKLFEAHAVIYNERFYNIYLQKHPPKYSQEISEYYLDNSYTAFDQWYAEYVQIKYPCFITKKILVVQKNDFSDIEWKKVWRKSRAEIIFIFYKYGLWKIVEYLWKYIKKILRILKIYM